MEIEQAIGELIKNVGWHKAREKVDEIFLAARKNPCLCEGCPNEGKPHRWNDSGELMFCCDECSHAFRITPVSEEELKKLSTDALEKMT